MRLLLDVHHSPVIAEILQRGGYDVVAAATDSLLATKPDEDLLQIAVTGGRALVTEDVSDFDRIVRRWAAQDRHHAGIIFTPPRRFHRGSKAYPGNLMEALRALLSNPPPPAEEWVLWLQ